MVRSNEEWRSWGSRDPLYAVISEQGRRRDGSRPWADEEFVAHGAADFRDIRRQWQQYGMGSGTCIEIGCGSGRMTRQLLDTFSHVLAVDVSPDQVEQARRLLGNKAERVRFAVVEEPAIPAEPASCDGLFSSLVFQHIVPFAVVERYLEVAFDKLAPGATACFQIPIVGAHGIDAAKAAVIALHHLRVTVERWLGRHEQWEYMAYLAGRVFRSLQRIGYVDVELRMFAVGRPDEIQSFFFARTPPAS